MRARWMIVMVAALGLVPVLPASVSAASADLALAMTAKATQVEVGQIATVDGKATGTIGAKARLRRKTKLKLTGVFPGSSAVKAITKSATVRVR